MWHYSVESTLFSAHVMTWITNMNDTEFKTLKTGRTQACRSHSQSVKYRITEINKYRISVLCATSHDKTIKNIKKPFRKRNNGKCRKVGVSISVAEFTAWIVTCETRKLQKRCCSVGLIFTARYPSVLMALEWQANQERNWPHLNFQTECDLPVPSVPFLWCRLGSLPCHCLTEGQAQASHS